MSKQGTPRTAKPFNGSPARKRPNAPAPSTNGAEAPMAPTISYEDLAARAYGRFLARGGQHGDDWSDWFQAEVELRQELERGRNTPRE
jgi:hypothetical protein